MNICKDSLSGINGEIRPGIVHRIDKNTSGLLIVAKNDFAHVHLAEQIKEHSLNRIYQTIVYGVNMEDEGDVDAISRGTYGTLNAMFEAFGYTAVPIYHEREWNIYLDVLKNAKPVIKKNTPIYR